MVAGPEALEIRDVTIRAFARLLDAFQRHDPDSVGPTALVSEATVGGIYAIVIRRIRDGEARSLPRLGSSLAPLLLSPIVGYPQAQRELASIATL
ncbi:MAG: hypothetical protein E6J20_00135 [Chloroflexi bacterium]|nr:MAG: hypothetical protein E6J20_00135 [Chloroflexota bacterium]